MKKISTPAFGQAAVISRKGGVTPLPRTSTISFLRQFARAYCPAPARTMPGIVLN
ncbi:MAG: hypothetical protein K2L77_07355 [Muribaculaceae bacterium]|nr:hypothetical protein [Muribaculaceae bacterium]